VAATAIYPYLGAQALLYSQYLDVTAGQCPLEAVPGGAYAMIPAPGYEDAKGASLLEVPPADGRWGEELKPKAAAAAREVAA
jgi:hypothetical protein